MRSFFDHVPEHLHDAIREAIEAVTETKFLLDQVQERFGTKDPGALRGLLGQVFDGITVSPEAVAELETLVQTHESRRAACQTLLDQAARGGAAPANPGGEAGDE